MAKAKTPTISVADKPALSLGEAAALTPIGTERLAGYIQAGLLRAKRNADEDGKPTGRYIIRREDLDKFLASLPDA